jgi:hypothetical protein
MPPQKSSTLPYIAIGLVTLIVVGIGIYIIANRNSATPPPTNTDVVDSTFTPFGRVPPPTTNNGTTYNQTSTTSIQNAPLAVPTLRLLSNTPVGGYSASTTASTTIVRWVDRGRGNIYEAHSDNSAIVTVSNTIVPKIISSIWNKNLTAFVSSTFTDSTPGFSTLYAELKARVLPKVATSTSNRNVSASTTNQRLNSSAITGSSISTDPNQQTTFELKGKNLPSNIITYAASPKKDKIFFMVNESGYGVGYTATFDGKSVTQIFSTPVTQVNAEWPEENTIALTTKGSATLDGFLYFVNPKTGIWKKVIGPILGLSTKVSHDAKYVLASYADKSSIGTSIYVIATQVSSDAVIHTLADKCVWGNFTTNMIYCAVPAQPINGSYPDDWYGGIISNVDKIWQINATSGEIHLVTSIVDQSDRVIDAFNLGLDPKDEFLFFMNKNDLSLWSFDLVTNKVQ